MKGLIAKFDFAGFSMFRIFVWSSVNTRISNSFAVLAFMGRHSPNGGHRFYYGFRRNCSDCSLHSKNHAIIFVMLYIMAFI
jgi:hypothetical protein